MPAAAPPPACALVPALADGVPPRLAPAVLVVGEPAPPLVVPPLPPGLSDPGSLAALHAAAIAPQNKAST
jgi:hypothetical protein